MLPLAGSHSNMRLSDVLVLTLWAACDDFNSSGTNIDTADKVHLFINQPEMCTATVSERLLAVVNHLAERQRTHVIEIDTDGNRTHEANFNFPQLADAPACASGTFNKIPEAVSQAHPCVRVDIELKASLQATIQASIDAVLAQHPEQRDGWCELVKAVVYCLEYEGNLNAALSALSEAAETNPNITLAKAIKSAITTELAKRLAVATLPQRAQELGLKPSLSEQDRRWLLDLNNYYYLNRPVPPPNPLATAAMHPSPLQQPTATAQRTEASLHQQGVPVLTN